MTRKAVALILLTALVLSVTGCEMILSMLGLGLVEITNHGKSGTRVTISGDKGGTQSTRLEPGQSDVFLIGTSSSYAVSAVNDQLWINAAIKQAEQFEALVLRPLEMTDQQWNNLKVQLEKLNAGLTAAKLAEMRGQDTRACAGTLFGEDRTATVSISDEDASCD